MTQTTEGGRYSDAAMTERSGLDGASSGAENQRALRVLTGLVLRPGGPRFGGAANAARLLAKHVAKLVSVDFAEMADRDEENPWEGGSYYFCKSYAVPRGLRRVPPFRSPLVGALTVSSIPRLLRRGGYDLLHIHNLHPIWAAAHMVWSCRRIGKPSVFTTHGLYEAMHYDSVAGLSRWGSALYRFGGLTPLRYVVRKSTRVIALTPADIEYLDEMGVDRERVAVIPNGVDSRFLAQASEEELRRVRAKYRLAHSPVLLFVGRVIRSKGLDVLVRMAARLEGDWQMLIVGYHDDPAHARELVALANAERCAERIKFIGDAPSEDLPLLYGLADIFVYPTLADTMPLVVLEAMASRAPVVASRVGGIPYELGESAGLTVEAGDPVELAEAVGRLLADEGLRREMGEAGRRRVEAEFTWDRIARMTVEVYRQVASEAAS